MIIFNSNYCQEEYLKLSTKTRMVKTREMIMLNSNLLKALSSLMNNQKMKKSWQEAPLAISESSQASM